MSGIPEGEAGAALRALLTDSVVGLAVWDTGLRCVWVNDALERYDGIARERRLGRRPRESLTGDTGELEALVRRVLATGRCVTGREYRVPTAPDSRRDRAFSASFVRLHDDGGHILVCAC
ncbi:PAS domain-containing protein [Streptomyces violaceoruber]